MWGHSVFPSTKYFKFQFPCLLCNHFSLVLAFDTNISNIPPWEDLTSWNTEQNEMWAVVTLASWFDYWSQVILHLSWQDDWRTCTCHVPELCSTFFQCWETGSRISPRWHSASFQPAQHFEFTTSSITHTEYHGITVWEWSDENRIISRVDWVQIWTLTSQNMSLMDFLLKPLGCLCSLGRSIVLL